MIAKITLIVPMSEYNEAFDRTPTAEEVETTFRDHFLANHSNYIVPNKIAISVLADDIVDALRTEGRI